jgi:hypothetical protein
MLIVVLLKVVRKLSDFFKISYIKSMGRLNF